MRWLYIVSSSVKGHSRVLGSFEITVGCVGRKWEQMFECSELKIYNKCLKVYLVDSLIASIIYYASKFLMLTIRCNQQLRNMMSPWKINAVRPWKNAVTKYWEATAFLKMPSGTQLHQKDEKDNGKRRLPKMPSHSSKMPSHLNCSDHRHLRFKKCRHYH